MKSQLRRLQTCANRNPGARQSLRAAEMLGAFENVGFSWLSPMCKERGTSPRATFHVGAPPAVESGGQAPALHFMLERRRQWRAGDKPPRYISCWSAAGSGEWEDKPPRHISCWSAAGSGERGTSPRATFHVGAPPAVERERTSPALDTRDGELPSCSAHDSMGRFIVPESRRVGCDLKRQGQRQQASETAARRARPRPAWPRRGQRCRAR